MKWMACTPEAWGAVATHSSTDHPVDQLLPSAQEFSEEKGPSCQLIS